jgi:hypothetical protein
LHEALRQLSPNLADLYLGAVIARTNDQNPDRLPQAAHSVREMMNAMPGAVGVEVRELDERFGNRLSGFRDSWGPLRAREANAEGEPWQGEIDRVLRRFLTKASGFFAWYDEHKPRRRAEFGDTLNRLEPSARSLPSELQATNVAAWESMREFFIKVCHHSVTTDVQAFDARLEQLEAFLLDRLQPRTFEDFDEIDAILREGQARDL